MGYNTKWQFSFKDYGGTTRWVYLQLKDYTGSTVTTLTPAEDPIGWDEDNSDNLLSYVRGKTGYIEVYEMTYGELSDMIPSTNTQIRVVCPGLFWGYVKAQSSSYAWDAGPRKLRFNILSPLAMANEIKMPIGTTDERTWDSVMKDLLDTIGYTEYIYPSTVAFGTFSGLFINPLAHDKEYHYENNAEAYEPISIGGLLEAICNYYGLIVHDYVSENTPKLLFTSVSYVSTYYRRLWNETLQRWVNFSVNVPQTMNNLLSGVEIADNSNKEQIVKPYSDITIRLGGSMFGDCDLPTEISDYQSNGELTPHGDWFENEFPSQVEVGGALIDGNMEDSIRFNEHEITDNAHMFTLKMVEYDRKFWYNIYITKKATGVNKMRVAVSSSEGGLIDNGTFDPISLGVRDIDFSTLENNEATIVLNEVPKDYLKIECYKLDTGQPSLISSVYGVKMKLREGIADYSKYEDKSFVKKLTGGEGAESITIERILNNIFSTNYYNLQNGTPCDFDYLLYSQLRVQLTLRSMTDYDYMLYLLNQSIDNTGRGWRVLAVSVKPRDNTYTITLHYSTHF